MKVVSKYQVPAKLASTLKDEVDNVVAGMAKMIVDTVNTWLEKTCKEENVKLEDCELHVQQFDYLDTYVLKKDDKLVGVPLTINWTRVEATADAAKKEALAKEVDNAVPVKESNVRTEQPGKRTRTSRNKEK